MKFILSLFLLIILTGSCNGSKAATENNVSQKSNKMQNTISGTYSIIQIEGNDAISPKLNISFDEKSNRVTGFAGCNSFFGNYTTQDNNIKFSKIGSSKKLCQNEINTIENQFLKVLNSANAFTIKGDVLLLLEDDSQLLKGNKTNVTKSTNTNDTPKSEVIRGNYQTIVKYKAITRGSFNYTEVSKSNIAVSTDNTLKKIDNYDYEEKDWEELNTLIEAVNLETFQKLKAPSTKRFSDGAAHATLALIIGDVEYMTPEFDHGNPPKEIETLVNKVLSLKENAIKK